MDDAERSALYAAMYDLDAVDELPAKKPGEASLDAMGNLRKSRRMVMGAVSFDIPTVGYVESLEQRLIQQERLILEQARVLRRFDSMFIQLKASMRKQSTTVNEMNHNLENKIDRRDLS